ATYGIYVFFYQSLKSFRELSVKLSDNVRGECRLRSRKFFLVPRSEHYIERLSLPHNRGMTPCQQIPYVTQWVMGIKFYWFGGPRYQPTGRSSECIMKCLMDGGLSSV